MRINYLLFLSLFVFSACLQNSSTKSLVDAIPPDASVIAFSSDPNPELCTFLEIDLSSRVGFNLPGRSEENCILVQLEYTEPVWLEITPLENKDLLPEKIESSVYQNTSIYVYQDSIGPAVFWAAENEILFISNNALAVEKAIYQLKQGTSWLKLNPSKIKPGDIWKAPSTLGFAAGLWTVENESENKDYSKFINSENRKSSPNVDISTSELLKHVPGNCTKIERLDDGFLLSFRNGEAVKVYLEKETDVELFDFLAREDYLNVSLQQYLHPTSGAFWTLEMEGLSFQSADPQSLKSVVDYYLAGSVLESKYSQLQQLISSNKLESLLAYELIDGQAKWMFHSQGQIQGFLISVTDESSLYKLFSFEMQDEGASDFWYLSDLNLFLIQDRQYQLYALDTSGTLVWDLGLNEELIIGLWAISGINKREKDRLLIQTTSACYQFIPGETNALKSIYTFPEEAKIKACVYQFEPLGLYHIFIPFPSGKIIGIDQQGALLPGWEQSVPAGKTDFPILHFQWAESDYNLVLDQEGKLWAFDRFGKLHWQPKYIGVGLTPLQVFLSSAQQRIAFIDSTSAIRVSNLKGESFGLRVPVEPPIIDFNLNPFNQKSNPVYRLLDQSKLIDAGYRQNSFEVFKRQSVTPGTSAVYTTEMTGDIIAYWINERKVLSLEQDLGRIQFDQKPLLIPAEEGYLLIGYSGKSVQGYKVLF